MSILPKDNHCDDSIDTTVQIQDIKGNPKMYAAKSGNDERLHRSMCVSCPKGPASHALVPCGHVCLCKKMFQRFTYQLCSTAWALPSLCVVNELVQFFWQALHEIARLKKQ